ncbi:MAG: hypothetical protein HY736_03245 [Verrucomicrobia bacterium]|nr:hypothetical protein [Verrucomicrobiota bacterium]
MKRVEAHWRAAIGFTVKSGWAAVVLVGDPVGSLVVHDSRRLDLSDPAIPEALQPYHAGFGTARSSDQKLSRLVDSVKRFGRKSVVELIQHYRAEGHNVVGVGIVVGSLINPEQIANAHIRIHALEGQLFRRVVEGAAGRSNLEYSVWRERDLYGRATEILKQTEPELRTCLSAFSGLVRGSWRAEQKIATLAGWLELVSRTDKSARQFRRGQAVARCADNPS